MNKILVVDPDRIIAPAAIAHFFAQGEGVVDVLDLHDAEDGIARGGVDALVIGSLPADLARVDACRRIRRLPHGDRISLLIAVPQKLARTRIRCLEEGADAVLDLPVLAEGVTALLGSLRQARRSSDNILEFGDVVMSTDEVKVRVGGVRLALSPTAYRLMQIFLENPHRIISRDELMLRLGSRNIKSSRTIDSMVRRLRSAMSGIGVADPFIAVPQHGYSLGTPHPGADI